MNSSSFFYGDTTFWLLALAGPVVAFLLYRMLTRRAAPPATQAIQPKPIVPDHMPVPTQRVGIPSTALVRIQDACGGHIKDGELDIRFELRSRRDCDKMLEALRGMRENLQRTKAIFGQAETEIRTQLEAATSAAGKITGRVSVMLGRAAPLGEDFVTAKRAELDGYEQATRLIDKFILELGEAESSLLGLPFYEDAAPVPVAAVD